MFVHWVVVAVVSVVVVSTSSGVLDASSHLCKRVCQWVRQTEMHFFQILKNNFLTAEMNGFELVVTRRGGKGGRGNEG